MRPGRVVTLIPRAAPCSSWADAAGGVDSCENGGVGLWACLPAMLHDPIHKLLCSFPRVIADILRGYARGKLGELVERLDLSTLEQVGAEHVSDRLQLRLSDAVWRVRRDDKRWVWVHFALEFQSRPDPGMSMRMLAYVALQYVDLQRKLGSGKLVPAVLGCVLYNGEDDWVERLETRSRIDLEPGSVVEEMLPRLKFPVIDERREGERKAPRGNAAWLMFRLWALETAEDLLELVGQVRRWLRAEEDRGLQEAFERVLEREVIPAYYPRGSVMREARGLANIETMLRGNVVPFSERYERRGAARGRKEGLEEGLEKGLAQGLAQGLEVIRDVQVRTARAHFGDEVAEQLAVMLASVRDMSLLNEVADIGIRARTGDELLLQVRALLEAGPGNGDLRQ